MPRLTTLASPALQLLRQATIPRGVAQKAAATGASASRSFSHLPSLRPTLHGAQGIFRSHQSPLLPTTATTTLTAEGGSAVLDLVPKSTISAHPALAGIASQIRCGPRPTMSNASRLIQKRRHGFLSRIRTNKGRKVLAARKAKGRRRLAA